VASLSLRLPTATDRQAAALFRAQPGDSGTRVALAIASQAAIPRVICLRQEILQQLSDRSEPSALFQHTPRYSSGQGVQFCYNSGNSLAIATLPSLSCSNTGPAAAAAPAAAAPASIAAAQKAALPQVCQQLPCEVLRPPLRARRVVRLELDLGGGGLLVGVVDAWGAGSVVGWGVGSVGGSVVARASIWSSLLHV
jgi:hypothetical protein